jgi:DNA-binding XRE family transcriptional regulator
MAKGKYKEWITKEGLLKIEGWAKDGLTDEDIAYNMGINRKTLYEWKKKYPPISDALKTGKEVVDRKVENALFKNAIGYEYTEVKEYIEQTDDGKKKKKIEKTTKHVPANTTAQIFWLKNRKPKQWRDKQDVEHSGGLNITVDWGEEDEG